MIYFAQDSDSCNIKIGYTGGADAQARINQLQTGCPSRIILLSTMSGSKEDETRLHRQFSAALAHGEWFRPVPALLRFILNRAALGLATEMIRDGADRLAKKAEREENGTHIQQQIRELLLRIHQKGWRVESKWIQNPGEADELRLTLRTAMGGFDDYDLRLAYSRFSTAIKTEFLESGFYDSKSYLEGTQNNQSGNQEQ